MPRVIACAVVASLVTILSMARGQPLPTPGNIAVDPNKLYLVIGGDLQADEIALVPVGKTEVPALIFEKIGNHSFAEIASSDLRSDGSLVLVRQYRSSVRNTLESANIYLIPGWPEKYIYHRDGNWFRRSALAAREFRESTLPTEIVVDRAIPVELEIDSNGSIGKLGVYGENALFQSAEPLIWCGSRAAVFEGKKQLKDQQIVARFHDPSAAKNRIEVALQSRGDRVVVNVSYEVNEVLDQDVPVHFRLPLREPASSLWGVAWRFTRSRKGGTGEQKFTEGKKEGSLYSFMSQAPMSIVRLKSGSYIGVLDNDLSNLVVEVVRRESVVDTVNVSTYLWPKEKGRTYHWTFELTTGYENLYNAVLRATWPYTKDNKEIYQGALGREAYNDFPTLDAAHDAGVRAVWHHRWFRRNGDYFNSDWPMDKPYRTLWPKYLSYDLIKGNVERFHSGGIQVYLYVQFAGISQDLVPKFGDSLVRDRDGNQIRAGQDGQMYNIWVNPDPAGSYGGSILSQIENLLDATGADGIALDRADRLDWTYGPDQYDYGHFNGYSSVFGERRPVASITTAGKAWFTELRKLLDRKGKKFLINSGAHMYVINLADSNMMELTGNPIALLFGKAFGNGKSTSFTIHNRLNDTTNNFFAEIVQGYPYHRDRARDGLKIVGVMTSERFPVDKKRGRLLYAISEDGRWPTLWYFDNGYTNISYHPNQRSLELKFRGSKFVPRGGSDSGNR
jgi:hypothetical protein